MTIEVIVPGIDESLLNEQLRRLVRAIHKAMPETRGMGGLLGGGDGYGADLETPVFLMRLHTEDPADCSCGAEDRNNVKYHTWVEAGRPESLRWTNEPCARDCAGNLPNFEHKASGFQVRWHKWIGRSMETLGECPDVVAMIDECVKSLEPRRPVVLVCGGRSFDDQELLFKTLGEINPSLIIHGACRTWDHEKRKTVGADFLAARFATARQIPVKSYPAHWARLGKKAGPIRNQEMLDCNEGQIDLVVAFPGGEGTADMVRRARKANIAVLEVSR